MITFQKPFVATKFPGYFFNTTDEKLYSMKIDGVLKPLKFHKPNQFNHMWRYNDTKGGYYCSVRGQRRFYSIEKLKELKDVPHVIPVKEKV